MLKRVQSRAAHRVFDEAHESAEKQKEVVEQRQLAAQGRLQQRVARRRSTMRKVAVVPKKGEVAEGTRTSADSIRRSITEI